MDHFLRRVLGDDLSVKFLKLASAGDYHKQRQAALHVDYGENNDLVTKQNGAAWPLRFHEAPKQEHEVVFLENLFDYLRQLAPVGK